MEHNTTQGENPNDGRTNSQIACPTCRSTNVRAGQFASTHPDDSGATRNRKCDDCGEAFDWSAGVDPEPEDDIIVAGDGGEIIGEGGR